MQLTRKLTHPVFRAVSLLVLLAGAAGCDGNAVDLRQMIHGHPRSLDVRPLVANPAAYNAMTHHRSYANAHVRGMQTRLLVASVQAPYPR